MTFFGISRIWHCSLLIDIDISHHKLIQRYFGTVARRNSSVRCVSSARWPSSSTSLTIWPAINRREFIHCKWMHARCIGIERSQKNYGPIGICQCYTERCKFCMTKQNHCRETLAQQSFGAFNTWDQVQTALSVLSIMLVCSRWSHTAVNSWI